MQFISYVSKLVEFSYRIFTQVTVEKVIFNEKKFTSVCRPHNIFLSGEVF
jgi:hypothetical protein